MIIVGRNSSICLQQRTIQSMSISLEAHSTWQILSNKACWQTPLRHKWLSCLRIGIAFRLVIIARHCGCCQAVLRLRYNFKAAPTGLQDFYLNALKIRCSRSLQGQLNYRTYRTELTRDGDSSGRLKDCGDNQITFDVNDTWVQIWSIFISAEGGLLLSLALPCCAIRANSKDLALRTTCLPTWQSVLKCEY